MNEGRKEDGKKEGGGRKECMLESMGNDPFV
jgi:hypothetical protein